jgi:hypothetical protein
MVNSSLKGKNWLYFTTIPAIALSWITIFWDSLILDPLLYRDDLPIINEIKATTGIYSYISKFLQGDFLDIQPLRDLSFFLNVFLERMIGYGGYHLFNIILSAFILITVWKILKTFCKDTLVLSIVILLMALHPSLNVVTAWTTNRKHLLSIFFILLYYKNWKVHQSHNLRNIVFYTLSVLSQPVTVFFPLILIVPGAIQRKLKSADFIALFILCFILGVNFYFYNYHPYFFVRNSIAIPFFDFEWILHLGRLFSQIFIPLVFAAEYNPANYLSLLGLLILVMLCFLFYKKTLNKSFDFVLFFLVVSSLYPIINLSIYRDAYGLISLLTLLPFFLLQLSKISRRLFYALASFLIPFFFYQSYSYVDMWESDQKLFTISAAKEGGAFNFINFAYMNRRMNPDLAYDLSVKIREQYPNGVSYHLFLLIAESFYYTKLKSKDEKLAVYLSTEGTGMYHLFFKYKFLAENGHLLDAEKTALRLKKELKDNPQSQLNFQSTICSSYIFECKRLGL